MTMERTIFFAFLCFAVEGEIGNHVFINVEKNWTEAQAYCRQHYTDLSHVLSESDKNMILIASASDKFSEAWIGLHRDLNDINVFIWSSLPSLGLPFENWKDGQPDNHDRTQYSVRFESNGEWTDKNNASLYPFYCFNVNVVETKMSWEHALNYCRRNHTDLASMDSETERLLAQKMMQQANIIEPVWLGLRYLSDRWLWINGDPLVYEGWPQEGDQDHQCPMYKRCGALTKDKGWESMDCQDKLYFICI